MADLFVAGGSGYIGGAFVRRAVAAGWRVRALARSDASRALLHAAGAEPVTGDLLEPGPWQEVAAGAAVVVHLAQPETYGARVGVARARRWRDNRLRMDAHLLDPLRPGVVRRVVYVCGTSYYGAMGAEPRDEDAPPQPRGWGPYVAPAVDALRDHVARGVPIVEAYPGWVYGPGSWYAEYILAPLRRGWTLNVLAGPDHIVVPVHVEDASRAILHLCDHGEAGRRYFVVDDRPGPGSRILELAAHALGVPYRVRRIPLWLYKLALGPILTESQTYDCNLTNARLRATGFAFDFPTVEQGVPDAVQRWLAARARRAS